MLPVGAVTQECDNCPHVYNPLQRNSVSGSPFGDMCVAMARMSPPHWAMASHASVTVNHLDLAL